MAEAGPSTSNSSTKINLIQLIQEQARNVQSDDHDGEWQLFSRFRESIYRFARQQYGSDQERSEQLERFKSAKSHEERISQLMADRHFNAVIEMLIKEALEGQRKSVKSSERANASRERGNELFKEKRFQEAYGLYSEAIRLSSTDSKEERTLAFANRSAALFHLGRFEDTIKDIDTVLSAKDYPVDRLYIIYGRKIQSLRMLNNQLVTSEGRSMANEARQLIGEQIKEDQLRKVQQDYITAALERPIKIVPAECTSSKKPRDIATSVRTSSDLIRAGSDAIKIQRFGGKGRGLLATRDIEPSEVIVSEKAFGHWLKPSMYDRFCYNCLKDIRLRHALPCRSCSAVSFCSKDCEAEAWDSYHNFECPFIDVLQIVSNGHLALRLILKVGIDTALELYEANKSKKPNTSINQNYKGDYDNVLELSENLEYYVPERLCTIAAGVAFITTLIKVKLSPSQLAKLDQLGGLLLKHILQINCNTIAVQFDETETDGGSPTLGSNLIVVGMGLYPTVALLNHSCDRKVIYSVFKGTQVALKSTGGIKAGQEVTLCYGPNSQKQSVLDRQAQLKALYFFDCTCTMCSKGQENVGLAFACPKCGPAAPLIVSSNYNYCMKCKQENLDLGPAIQTMGETKSMLMKTWPLVELGHFDKAEIALSKLLELNSKYFYQHCELILEIKEKLAYCMEQQKKLIPAAKFWLECFYGQIEIDGYDDSYEALFYLLKITQALIEDADRMLDRLDRVQTNLAKAKKYFTRAMSISKRLQGKECRVLEARSDLLDGMPEPTVVAKDLETLENYLKVAVEQMKQI